MIYIRECGHSEETDSLHYRKRPEVCRACAHAAKYGPPKRLHVDKHTIEMRRAMAENAKKHRPWLKRSLGPRNANKPL